MPSKPKNVDQISEQPQDVVDAILKEASGAELTDGQRKAFLAGATSIDELRSALFVSNQLLALLGRQADINVEQTSITINSDAGSATWTMLNAIRRNNLLLDAAAQKEWFNKSEIVQSVPDSAAENASS